MNGIVQRLREKFSIPHIHRDGARFHTPSWGLCVGKFGKQFSTSWCSEPFCLNNLPSLIECIENGLDPSKVIPSTAAKDWLRALPPTKQGEGE